MAQLLNGEKWIYDAICNGESNTPTDGTMFKFNETTRMYHYSNPKYLNTNCPIKKFRNALTFNPGAIMEAGDIINFEGSYMNERKMIFNGVKLMHLYTDIDDYGSIHPNFKVGLDYEPCHWKHAIVHNSIIFLEDDLFERIVLYEKDGIIEGKIDMFSYTYKIKIIYNNNNKFDEYKFKGYVNTNKLNYIESESDDHIIVSYTENKYSLFHQKYKIKPVNESKITPVNESKITPVYTSDTGDYDDTDDNNYTDDNYYTGATGYTVHRENMDMSDLDICKKRFKQKIVISKGINDNTWNILNYMNAKASTPVTIKQVVKDNTVLINEMKEYIINEKPYFSYDDNILYLEL